MSLSIEDLKPKPFTVKLGDQELRSKAPRLSHTLVIAKVGNIFENMDKFNQKQLEQAEKETDEVLGQLIPELKGIELSSKQVMELIPQIMEHIAPDDNKELEEKGVKFDTDPKAGKTG